MKKALTTILWIKFHLVIALFLISIGFNFVSTMPPITPEKTFWLLILGKPVLIFLFLIFLNFVFHFPKKISVPPVIPSIFLLLSILVFVDIGLLIFNHLELFNKYQEFWWIYGIVSAFCVLNLIKYIKAFTVGLKD